MGRGRGGRRPQHFRPQAYDPQAAQQAMDGPRQELMPLIRGREIDAGDLSGDYVEPVQASFTYFGARFRINPDLTETLVVDLLEAGEEIDASDPRQLIAVKDYARGHLHREDFDEFWSTAQDNRQTVHDVMKVCHRLLAAVTDRPTTPPSGSSDGRRDTPTSSQAGASAPVIESDPVAPAPTQGNAREIGERFAREFEEQGRPDKALQVMLAVEAREARGLVTV
jgi:hypothetical protein